MILKDNNASTRWLPMRVGLVLLFGLVVAFLSTFYTNNRKTTTDIPEGGVLCDAEKVVEGAFVTGLNTFGRGNTQSDDYAFSGSYSCKLEEAERRQYGFEYKLQDPTPGMTYKASVWRFRDSEAKSALVVSGPEGSDLYRAEALAFKSEKDWERIEIVFSIPINKKIKFVQFYVYSNGMGTVYFDDLMIEPMGNITENLGSFDLDTIRLSIPDKGMRKLENKRLGAFRNGILESADDDWVKGILSSKKGERKKVKLRLKGDWLNHLKGDKWSFRVKVAGGDAWNRLRHFSLQTPEARGYLHEWVLHQFLEKEDVLTTRYEFVMLELNGKSLGVYAIEEHFDKVLVESRQRREGVIVKFSESGFWESIKRQLKSTDRVAHGLLQNEKSMQAAEVLPFAEGTTLSNPVLTQQLERAQHLLQQYQFGNKPVEEVFDVDQLAKYFAICDVMGAYHGINWHNLRFYYNPLSAKLEPIGYDGFEKAGVYRKTIIGNGAMNFTKVNHRSFHFRLFLDKAFTEKYVQYLYELSEKNNLQTFFTDIENGLYAREQLIKSEFPKYSFSFKDWLRDALAVHILLLPQNNISLKAYTQEKTKDKKQLRVANIFNLPIEVIGYGTNENTMSGELEEPVLLEGYYTRSIYDLVKEREASGEKMEEKSWSELIRLYHGEMPIRQKNLEVSANATTLFFKPLGVDTLMHSKIFEWPSPYDPQINKDLLTPSKIASNDTYQLDDHVLFFPKGNHELTAPLIVPAGYRLHFEGGCKLNLKNGAFIWSASPVTSRGTEEEPVYIESTDGTGRGFHIMDPKEECLLDFTHFDGLNTLDVKERRLTGAVTFYEAEVELNNCTFRNNKCEDALNMIRSEFDMKHSVIHNTFADGLDADFCKGKVKN
ncbi:MAG: CotH kinase family protein, partial [Saprospiraceae bacterium]